MSITKLINELTYIKMFATDTDKISKEELAVLNMTVDKFSELLEYYKVDHKTDRCLENCCINLISKFIKRFYAEHSLGKTPYYTV